MQKLQLLEKIQKLSAIIHCKDLNSYNLTAASIAEMRNALDAMTEEYIAAYC
ncbi:hypothetical protein [Anaerosporomusa subterranea]|uniref:hypothetical protein n=1 Tax=Anaerosporomusa subterranea TaxID=1794912 RepID=UPI000AF99EDD|nr:hypothetical protein [Anaerosporomusa subterranea]